MCLSWLHFQPCAGSEPDCNCCLSNKYTYMQLRSPEVTRVNFHLTTSEVTTKLFPTTSATSGQTTTLADTTTSEVTTSDPTTSATTSGQTTTLAHTTTSEVTNTSVPKT